MWPERAVSPRPIGWRALLLGCAASVAAGALVWRLDLPAWATVVYLAFLAHLVLLSATDLEHRLIPNAVLGPLVVGAGLFVPFNPGVDWPSAIGGAIIGFLSLTLLGFCFRGGIAAGDLYLAVPVGLMVGLPGTILALVIASLLASVAGIALLITRRATLHSYMPFGPFFATGAVVGVMMRPGLLQL